MAKLASKDRLLKLKEQQEKIKARIQAIEARETTEERKKETRRKILLGAYHLEKAREENRLNEIKTLMQQFLTRDSDKELFNFE